MRNVVFLHKRTLYFAVASRKGCVDLSIVRCVNGVWVIGRIPHGMRGFKHCYLINIDIRIKVASRKGCVDLSVLFSGSRIREPESHPVMDAWI